MRERDMLHCEVCHLTFESQQAADGHFESKAHFNAVKFQQELRENGPGEKRFYCEICSIWTTSQALLNTHLECQSHQKKLKNRDVIKSIIKSATVLDIKQISLTDKDDRTAALPPSSEIIELDEIKCLEYMKTGVLFCQLCNLVLSSDQDYLSHVKTNNHVKRVECLKTFNQTSIHKSSEVLFSPTVSINSSPESKLKETTSSSSLTSIKDSTIEEIKSYYAKLDHCPCCYVNYTSTGFKLDHLNGRDHFKKLLVKEFQLSSTSREFVCSTCYTKCNSEDTYRVHMASDNHMAQETKRKEFMSREASIMKRSQTISPSVSPRETSPKKEIDQFVKVESDSIGCQDAFNHYSIDLVVFEPGESVLEKVLCEQQASEALDQQELELFQVLNRRLIVED